MSSAHRASLIALVLVVSLTAPALAQVSGTDARITGVSYTANGNFDASNETLKLWQSAAHEFTATVETDDAFDGEACVVTTGSDGSRTTLSCTAATIDANTTRELTIAMDGWSSDHTGPQNVGVELLSNGSTVATSDRHPITVLAKDGDLDDDGLSNADELSAGSRLRTADTDGDGLADGEEVGTYGTSATNTDSDGDGLTDREEIETLQTDATSADTDGDGLPDDQEMTVGSNLNKADSDGDGLDDAVEVNTYETNATMADTDGDGLGDGDEIGEYETNPTKTDTDDDGLGDALEVNTYETNPNTVDSDGDGLGDGAEVNTHQTDPANADTDDDGLSDGNEINAHGTSPTNADADDDGLADGKEVNRFGTDPTSADTDGDGESDRAEVRTQPWGHLPVPIIVIGALATVMTVAGGVLYRSDRGLDIGLPGGRSGGDGDPPRSVHDAVTAPEGGEATTDDIPPEFLSNEERITRLLEENEGRMRQAEIVDRTGWSKSKVSRVLTGMAEEERIVKVDVGKGNVITLPERVPPGAESPFDE